MSATLQGRVALVTGGNRGIGAGIARVLAHEGCAVAINYRSDKASAEATLKQIESAGGRAKVYGCDIGPAFDPVRKMADQVATDFGKLDILVNNAGINLPAMSVEQMNLEELRRVYDTNFFGAVHATKAALPHLRKAGRGDVIFISSAILTHTPALRMPYSTSKAACEALAHSVAKEELRQGVRVNIVRPGLVASEMGDSTVRRRGLTTVEDLKAAAPFGRIAQPEDIGRAIVFLCSTAGEYITGGMIPVDGGGIDWLPAPLPQSKPAS